MTTDAAQGVSLGYYVDVLRERAWVVLLCGLLGLALAFAALAVMPVRATATAAVSVDVITTDPFNSARSASGLIDPAGEALVARSFVVAERAAEELGGDYTAMELRESSEVTVVPDTTVLRISSTAQSAERATAMADELARQYLAQRSERAQERIDRILSRTQDRLEGLREELSAVDEVILDADEGSVELAQAETERSILTLEIDSVLSAAATAGNIDTTGGVVLNPAATNPVDWFPPRGPVLLSGTLAGLGLGVLAAFVVNALDGRVRTARDVVVNGGRRVIGDLREKRVTAPPSGSDIAELRAVRERILAEPVLEGRSGVLAVLDETPGGQGADVAANLATTLASAGVEVEFIAIDLERDGVEGSGEVVDEPLSPQVREELRSRRQDVMVVLSIPHGGSPATRLAAGRLSEVAVLVVARNRTRSSDLARTAQDLRTMGTQLMGTILVPGHRTSDPRSGDAHRDHQSNDIER
jgi:capsular polysaccharide biosynthesis protein